MEKHDARKGLSQLDTDLAVEVLQYERIKRILTIHDELSQAEHALGMRLGLMADLIIDVVYRAGQMEVFRQLLLKVAVERGNSQIAAILSDDASETDYLNEQFGTGHLEFALREVVTRMLEKSVRSAVGDGGEEVTHV